MGNDIQNVDDDLLFIRFQERYDSQPDYIKKKLDELEEMDIENCQLKVIKRKRTIPKRGDVFIVNPKENIYFYGVVINNFTDPEEEEEFQVVFILKNKAMDITDTDINLDLNNLLIEPMILHRMYWTKGYFYNTGVTIEIPEDLDYGFYDSDGNVFVDEYGNKKDKEPLLLGSLDYTTIFGVGYEITQELIMDENLILYK